MVPLESRDLRRLLEYGRTFEAADMRTPAGVFAGLLVAVGDLVPGEIAVISVTSADLTCQTYATDDALAARRNGALGLWRQCIDEGEHSVIRYHDDSGDRAAVTTSDFMSGPRLRQTTLFDYFWRPFAIDRSMGARIDVPDGNVYLASYRSGLDFSERDRVMLDGLASHARRLLHRTEVSDLATDCRVRFDLTARESEVAAWAVRGRTVPAIAALLVLSPATVKAHLRNVYRKTGWRSRAVAMAHLYGELSPDEVGIAAHKAAHGLTGRETDVIMGLARGWTNIQIASALSVSLETTKTHLRHAYEKLGAGNRVEATARLRELRSAGQRAGLP